MINAIKDFITVILTQESTGTRSKRLGPSPRSWSNGTRMTSKQSMPLGLSMFKRQQVKAIIYVRLQQSTSQVLYVYYFTLILIKTLRHRHSIISV